MRLAELRARRFRSLRDVRLPIGPLNLLIGANASGKSNVLDALRLMAEAVDESDFERPVNFRGGVHLSWKGETATDVVLETRFEDHGKEFFWKVALGNLRGPKLRISEEVHQSVDGGRRELLLESTEGQGKWYTAGIGSITLALPKTTGCALSAAAALAEFPARALVEFVGRWRFFDPSPALLRRASGIEDGGRLDALGRNLAARLNTLRLSDKPTYQRILEATRKILGVPDDLKWNVSDAGLVYFLQHEAGLAYPVHQIGASSGTLRVLALMTALLGESSAGLVGIEEPENHVHPAALDSFAQYLKLASEKVQVLVTTHSPRLLSSLGEPGAVCVVRRTEHGTDVQREDRVAAVQQALTESGFGLGEYHETKGFGVP